MNQGIVTYRNGFIFDGKHIFSNHALRFKAGHVTQFGPEYEIATDGEIVDLDGDILSPGYVDLQVNGGDGIMFNDDPSVKTLSRIASAHEQLGVTSFLPTLITDTPTKTREAISAAIEAVKNGTPGIAGLHLEGPHLSIARKGAHDPALIRSMDSDDLNMLLSAAEALPILKVTIAPENVTLEQVITLSRAGVLISLGHTDADFETCQRYFTAGARCTTHLFNAMSQFDSRKPGLVGATLVNGTVSAGLIADAVHVHPETMRVAWAAKTGPGRIFLISDSMAVAGTDLMEFELNGRTIRRHEGILTLADGTLAGADLDLTNAIRILVQQVGIPLEAALQAATTIPASLISLPLTSLKLGEIAMSKMIRIKRDLSSVSKASAD